MVDPVALYRHFDAEGRLLYVGVSLNPVQRLVHHENGSEWFYEIANVTIEWIDGRDDALSAEYAAIIEEKPIHNKVHSTTWVRPVVSPTPRPEIQMNVYLGDFHDKPHYVEFLEGQAMMDYITSPLARREADAFIDDSHAEGWAAARDLKPIWT